MYIVIGGFGTITYSVASILLRIGGFGTILYSCLV